MEIMLDSGAFSAYNLGKTINLEEYGQFILDNLRYIDLYINLDVMGDAEKTWENQEALENMGLKPLPVYHIDEDIKYLNRAMEYDYFCVGGAALSSIFLKTYSYERIWNIICDTPDRKPKHKVHGLGMASTSFLYRYPWYSIDTTSWVMYGKYGAVLIPKNKNNHYDFTKNPHIVWVSTRSPKMSKIDGQHFNTFTRIEKMYIEEYVSHHGFSIDELAKEGRSRDDLNLRFFLEIEKQIPKWPWPFYKSNQLRLI